MAVRKIPVDLKGLEYKEQTDFTTVGAGAYTEVRARKIKFVPEQTMIQPDVQRSEALRGPEPRIPAGKGGTLAFEVALRGGASVSMSEFMSIAQYAGTVNKRAGTAGGKIKSGTATTLVALTADIGTYEVGDIIGLDAAAASEIQLRGITRVQDDTPIAGDTTITVDHNWDTNPAASDDLVDVDTLLADLGEPSKYLSFKVYSGQGATDRHLYTIDGCAGTWKLNTTDVNTEPVVEFTFKCNTWTSTEASTTQAADAWKPAHPLLGDILAIDNAAVPTRNIGFDPRLVLEEYPATEGTAGKIGWLFGEPPIDGGPVVEITPYHDTAWITKWEGATPFNLFFESVKDDDEAWCIWCPSCQVVNVTPDDAGNKHQSSKPTIQVNNPGKNTDLVNYPRFAIGVTGVGP